MAPRLRGYGRGGDQFFHVNGIAGNPYPTLTQALLGNLPVTAMAVLCVLKLAATVTSYSSGGSGGIFAPALYMGGMLGGAVGYLDVTVFHHPADSIGAFAVVGMGAVFAGTVRAPMTSILIIFEMTGGYGLVLPLMIANMSAFALARHWRHTPIYEALLAQDGIYLDQRHKPHGPAGQAAVPVEELRAGEPDCQRRRATAPILCALLPRLHVVEEVGAQLQIRAVELPGEWGIAGAGDGAPGRAVQPGVAGAAIQLHVGHLAVGQNLEADSHHARLRMGGLTSSGSADPRSTA